MLIFSPRFRLFSLHKLLPMILVSLVALPLGASECPAPKEYITKYKLFDSRFRKELDYSCLTDYPSISLKIKSFQLVDIRKNPDFEIEQAWIISVEELRHKAFLTNRPLLLLGDSFSRVNLAYNCALLKKAGFTNVKMLIGGAPQWRQPSSRKKLPTAPQFVSARNVITEYFNGRISIVSASKSISEKLKKIGVTKFHTLDSNQFSAVSDLVVGTSNGGFDPVVYIGDSQSQLDFAHQHALPNLYQLQGGIDALVAQLNSAVLVEASREAPQGKPFCAK